MGLPVPECEDESEESDDELEITNIAPQSGDDISGEAFQMQEDVAVQFLNELDELRGGFSNRLADDSSKELNELGFCCVEVPCSA